MTFTRSTLLIACSLASAFAITACSNANNEDKKQTTLTASAPATGEASTLIERNAQQRLSTTLQQHFKTAGISAKITDKTLRVINIVCGIVIIFYGLKLLWSFIQMVLPYFG